MVQQPVVPMRCSSERRPSYAKAKAKPTIGCRPGVTGDWTDYEAALIATGYTVAHHIAPLVERSLVSLTQLVKDANIVVSTLLLGCSSLNPEIGSQGGPR